ncbi:MAG: hypothetical protein HYV09_35570 [Deltaproteobacteria bacterium]|nr:hypothetical protein [Deltaproteobacteria bacterium]
MPLARISRGAFAVALASQISCSQPSQTSQTSQTSDASVETSSAPLVESESARGRIAGLHARFHTLTAGASGFELDGSRARALVPAAARPARVDLPLSARDAAHLEDLTSHVAVAFALVGASDAKLASAGGIARYAGAYEGSDLLHRPHAEGTEDLVVFETKPAHETLVYDVDVTRVAGLRLQANVLEFLDASGSPRLRVAPPYVVDEAGKRTAATLSVEGCAVDTSPAAPWDRPVTPPGAARCAVRVAWSGVRYPAMVDPSWTATGSMAVARGLHTATVLSSGEVLIAGGGGSTSAETSAELYNPTSGVFASTGVLKQGRSEHGAALTGANLVLIVGGSNSAIGTLDSAELYNRTSGTFTFTSSYPLSATGVTATTLPTGNVLVAGGYHTDPESAETLSFAMVYSSGSGTFGPSIPMAAAHFGHSATLLASGKVLVAGGGTSVAELFDPTAGTFTTTASLASPRSWHSAVRLPSGKVLLAGGGLSGGTTTAEIFDPAGSGSFAPTGSMGASRRGHVASLLAGRVIVAGGSPGSGHLSSAELFDPAASSGVGAFATIAAMASKRSSATISQLSGSKVLVVGGQHETGVTSTAEIYALSADGATCSTNNDCISARCVDGVCCTSACTGTCQKCAAGTGTCGTVASADDPDTCAGTSTCDASGACKKKAGQICAAATECVASACNERCCSASCTGSCKTCDTSGACVSVTGADDPNTCTGDNTCDASGVCKLKPGKTCSAGSSCSSGVCQDGTCCSGACTGTCKTCNGTGACVSVTSAEDADTCAGTSTCDAAGACKLKAGQSCSGAPATCASGLCNENCCSSACTGTCKTCNGTGACVSVTNAEDPDTCNGTKVCDASGACKFKTGQVCSVGADCASGVCNNGVCCSGACSGTCKKCELGTGACTSVISADDPDTCTGGSTCDASGACKAKAGQACTASSDCNSGICDGGICCAATCGTCQKCLASTGLCGALTGADDPDTCTGVKTCDGTGTCKTKPGKACTAGSECASGVCQDGVCCGGACSGACKTCVAESGACVSVTSSDDPDSCSGTSTCDAAGACKKKSGAGQTCGSAGECANGLCVDGYCCDTGCGGACDRCNLPSKLGTCSPAVSGDPGQPSCSPVTCNGTSGLCPGSGACTSDAACGAGYYCDATGQCASQKLQGTACNASAGADCKGAGCRVCATGHCVDGFCCNEACSGACVACSATAKGSGANGACGPVPADTNPKGGCVADPGYPSSCKADGFCNGAGACRQYAKSSVACAASICAGSSTTPQLCNGSGSCISSTPVDCAPYACSGGACKTTCEVDADCVSTAYCTSGKTCAPKKDPGTACTADRECTGGNVCVDGFCCNSACNGQCEACDVEGHAGTCWPVSGTPHGGRKACTGEAGAACTGTCDGSTRGQCAYPPATKICGTTCLDDKQTDSTCDGLGSCVVGVPKTCDANLKCDGTAKCRTECGTNEHCRTGYSCNTGKCIPTGSATCSADGTQSIPSGGGEPQSCAPYRCGTDGNCKTACALTDDCAAGTVCDVVSKTCAPAAAQAEESSGGCATGARTTPTSAGWLAVLSALALALSRRRRAR